MRALRRPRRPPALGHRNYRLYLAAQGTSVVGTWMQNLGQAWLVLTLTGDPFILGLVVAAQGLPVVVLGLFGGVVADRVEKRRLVFGTHVIMLTLALTLGLLCLTGAVQTWQVLLLALAFGCVFSIDFPTRQSMVIELVGPADVGSAVGLNSTVYSVGRLVGPAIAGAVIAGTTAAFGDPIVGTGIAFLVNAASYGAMLVALSLMRADEMLPSERTGGPRRVGAVLREVGEGLRFVRATPAVLATIAVPGLIAVVAVNFNVLVPALAAEAGLDAGGLGLLMTAAGFGALLAALRVGLGGGVGPRALAGSAALLGAAQIAVGGTGIPLLALALLFLFLAGAGATGMRTAANTMVQLASPPHMRGRMMGIFTIVFEGASPLGGILSGALAAALGARASFAVVGAVALLLAAITAWVLLGRRTSG